MKLTQMMLLLELLFCCCSWFYYRFYGSFTRGSSRSSSSSSSSKCVNFNSILIKFCLLKTVDAIMWGHTLMLLILVQTSATIRLPREEILLLKVLRIVLIILQNVLLATVALVAALAVWSTLIRGLARCISVHQISFIELIFQPRFTW